jgi:hypothetical protein
VFDESGLFIQLPTVMKAHEVDGKRLVEICASKQVVDDEGDLVLQTALLNSGPGFVKSGHLDLEHISEIFDRIPGIKGRASDYIVGNPMEVRDLGGGATGVIGELQKGNPHADEIWSGLTASPPVRWQASIYGYPTATGLHDARTAKSSEEMMGATRFLVTGIDWRSLAFTRRPINTAVDAARVYTAKAFMAFMKSQWGYDSAPSAGPFEVTPTNYLLVPRNVTELAGHVMHHMKRGQCPHVNKTNGLSRDLVELHFMHCCGMDEGLASIFAHAVMHWVKREKAALLGLSPRG